MVNIIPFGCLWWLRGKIKSSCNAGDLCLISALGRSPGEGHGNPLQYSYLENPMDRGAWGAACSPRGHKESDATEVAKQQQRNSFQHIVSWAPWHSHTQCPRRGNRHWSDFRVRDLIVFLWKLLEWSLQFWCYDETTWWTYWHSLRSGFSMDLFILATPVFPQLWEIFIIS